MSEPLGILPVRSQAVEYVDSLIKEICELRARVAELETQVVYGFYEEEYPMYSQGPAVNELQDPITAEEANGTIANFCRLKDASIALVHFVSDASPPSSLRVEIERMQWEDRRSTLMSLVRVAANNLGKLAA